MLKGYNTLVRAIVCDISLTVLLLCIKHGFGKPVQSFDGWPNVTTTKDVLSTSVEMIPPTAHPVRQEYVNPFEIDDGQSIQDKLRIMYLLSALERRVEKLFKLRNNSSEEETKTSATDLPYLFEGDIILQPDQAEEILANGKRRRKRKLHANVTMLWHMPIWYTYDDNEYNSTDAEMIKEAVRSWEDLTCITFKRINYTDLHNSTIQAENRNNLTLYFTNSTSGCWSYVGKRTFQDNVQKVSASKSCMTHGRLLHELGHVIGFWHEHARPDRDDHVTVNSHAIRDGKHYNFIKLSWKEIDDKNISYDVGSIMHYGSKAFAAYIDTPTLVAKDPLLQRAFGQRLELSFFDVKLANTAYCMHICDPSELSEPCQNEGYQDPKNCSRCRCPDGLSGDFCEIIQSHEGEKCGYDMTIKSTNVKVIFGFPNSYNTGQKCTWRFKSANHTNLRLKFDGGHMMYLGCTDDPFVSCRDFVEVRYFHSMAATGARFCCFQRNEEVSVLSQGNEMMVIMRTFGPGMRGFEASITIEKCGGVMGSNETEFRPCTRQISYSCPRQWKTQVREPCPGSFGWMTNCYTMKVVNVTREGLCYETENYCAPGFQLNDHVCIASNTSTIDSEIIQTGSSNNGYSSTNSTIQNDPEIVASTWSEWSQCSRSCGGCGKQTRQRSCAFGQSCGLNNIETETRKCGLEPCYTGIAQMCPTVRSSEINCPLTLKTIKQEWISYQTCFTSCCENYYLKNGACVMWVQSTEQC